MKAILLAAGLGTRLRPLTDTVPKCLVPIGGKPLLGYWLDALAEAGIIDILINLHHLADQVRSYVQARPDSQNITLVYEKELLGTAGTIRENADFFKEEQVMVIHADNFCTADLKKFIMAHDRRPAGTEITMMTFITDQPETCGIVETNSFGVVTAFHEKVKNPPGNIANGAVYIWEPTVVRVVAGSEKKTLDISVDVVPYFLERMITWLSDGVFIDIGTHQNLENASRLHLQPRDVDTSSGEPE